MPFLPLSLSYSTLSFSLILSIKPDECTKMSSPPLVGTIKPNPIVSLKKITFPSCMVYCCN